MLFLGMNEQIPKGLIAEELSCSLNDNQDNCPKLASLSIGRIIRFF